MLRPRVSPLAAGTVLGVGAALVQAYFHVVPPVANGFCFICHPRDLFDWISNSVFATDWPVSAISATYPVLTVIGVLLGAFVAASLVRSRGVLRVAG